MSCDAAVPAGARPAASAVSCRGPGLSRGFVSPLRTTASGGTSSSSRGTAAAAAASEAGAGAGATSAGGVVKRLGGLGAAGGRGTNLGGMFGGPAYRVAGLRRPAKR